MGIYKKIFVLYNRLDFHGFVLFPPDLGSDGQILIQKLYFLCFGRRLPGAVDDPVAAEIIIRGPVRKVSAITQHLRPIQITADQRLVYIIPDKSALIHGIPVLQIRIFFHPSKRIAHGVGVLTQDKGLLRIILQILDHILGFGIHLALHVADILELPVPEDALVVDDPGRISVSEKPGHGGDILSRVSLVAAGPYEDCRVVLVPLQHGHCPVHHAGLPLRQAAGDIPGRLADAHLLPGTMAFQVGLIDHVQAVLIAQLIPSGLVGIVAGADRIDIVLLHEPDIPHHIFFRHCPASPYVELVAVDSLKDDPFSVDAHDPFSQFKMPEAHGLRNHLHGLSIFIQKSQAQPVKGRILCGPGSYLQVLHGQYRHSVF